MKEKKFGKKQVALGAMVLLLGAAVYLNFYVASNTTTPLSAQTSTSQTTRVLGESQFVSGSTAPTTDYFDTARGERESARREALDILQETLQDVKIDAAAQQEAMTAVAAAAKAVEQEDAAESLIKAKGFEDCVVYIEGDACHVVVKGQELSQAQTLQITQILLAQTDVAPQNIHISVAE